MPGILLLGPVASYFEIRAVHWAELSVVVLITRYFVVSAIRSCDQVIDAPFRGTKIEKSKQRNRWEKTRGNGLG